MADEKLNTTPAENPQPSLFRGPPCHPWVGGPCGPPSLPECRAPLFLPWACGHACPWAVPPGPGEKGRARAGRRGTARAGGPGWGSRRCGGIR